MLNQLPFPTVRSLRISVARSQTAQSSFILLASDVFPSPSFSVKTDGYAHILLFSFLREIEHTIYLLLHL
jgi:hypothetical protein